MKWLRRKRWWVVAVLIILIGGLSMWSISDLPKPVIKFLGIHESGGGRVATLEVEYDREGSLDVYECVFVRDSGGSEQEVYATFTIPQSPGNTRPSRFTFPLPPTSEVEPFEVGVIFAEQRSLMWDYVSDVLGPMLPRSMRKSRTSKVWSETITP